MENPVESQQRADRGRGATGGTTLKAVESFEAPWCANFDNPKHEWRRLFSEVFGTFLLVLVGAGGSVVSAASNGAIERAAAVSAPGLMVLGIILFMGAVSGAHLNPAVSIAFAARGDFPWRRVPGYIIAQLLGSTLAVLLLWAMLGKIGMLGATEPGAGVSDMQALVMEFILTVGLVSTILGTASKAQNVGPIAALGCRLLHHPRRSLVKPNQRRFDESSALVRARPCARQLRSLLGLSCRADPGRTCRCRIRLHTAWAGRGHERTSRRRGRAWRSASGRASDTDDQRRSEGVALARGWGATLSRGPLPSRIGALWRRKTHLSSMLGNPKLIRALTFRASFVAKIGCRS